MAKKKSQENKENIEEQLKIKEANVYKAEQKKRISALQVGTKDINGYEINLIYVRGNEYVIYDVKTNIVSESLKVYIDTEQEEETGGIIKNFADFRSSFAEFKSVLYKVQDQPTVKSRGAHLTAQALYGNIDVATTQINILIKDIDDQYSKQFKSRLRYLITALCFVLVNISLSIFIHWSQYLAACDKLERYLIICTAGSIGGFISITRRLDQTYFEKEITKFMFNIYAMERIFISIFASVIVYCAIRCNLVFGLVEKLPNPTIGYILFSVVAGFSETLVPNLLIKLESK